MRKERNNSYSPLLWYLTLLCSSEGFCIYSYGVLFCTLIVVIIQYYLILQFGDDIFETASCTGRLSNVYDSLRPGNTTTLIEGLQAQLKMRDGKFDYKFVVSSEENLIFKNYWICLIILLELNNILSQYAHITYWMNKVK